MTTNHFIKIGWRVCKPLALSGLMFTLAHSAYGMSCAAQPAPVQNQKQPSVEQLASLTVRSRIADSALVMQGAIESISEDHASMNGSTARLAVVRPTRIFKGNASTKYEVLVPMDTRLGEEVAIFANLESPEEIQARISFNRPEIKPTPKWTHEIRPLWIASDPCTARTYSIEKLPEIADSIKQVFGASAAAKLLIDLHVYSTGSPHQTKLNAKVNLVQKKIELVSVNKTRYSSQIHKRNGQLNDGFFTASLNNLPEGRYTLVPPKIAGMTAVCYVNLQAQNCSSIEIKSYASHKLQGIYRPSA